MMLADEKSFRPTLTFIAVLALALRLAHAVTLQRALGHHQIIDAAFYHEQARSLAGLAETSTDTSALLFANPGYPYALAAVYRVVGAAPLGALAVQGALGAACTVFIGLSARHLFRERTAGLFAALLWALFAPAIYYDGALLVPSLNALLATMVVFATVHVMRLLGRTSTRPTPIARADVWAACIGLCIGAATLLRPSNALYALTIPVALLSVGRGTRDGRIRASATVLVAAALAIAPFVAARSHAAGDWIPISANGGANFWIGNGKGATGLYRTPDFVARHDAGHTHTLVHERNAYLAEARHRTESSTLSLGDADRFWLTTALDEMRAAPLQWLQLMARKVKWLCNTRESSTNTSLAFLARFSPVLGWNPFGFGFLLVLGCLGLAQLAVRRRRSARLVLGAAIIVPFATALVFFVSAEYRHPASPALAIAGGFALSRVARGTLSKQQPLQLLAVVVIAALAFWPAEAAGDIREFKSYAEQMVSPASDGSMPTEQDYDRARALLDRLEGSYVANVVRHEALLLVHSNRAIQLQSLTDVERLIDTARSLWKLAPSPRDGLSAHDALRVHRNLRRRIVQLGAHPFLAAHPHAQEQLALLGANNYAEIQAYERFGKVQQARAFVQRALELAPSSVELGAQLGRLDLLLGDTEAGIARVEQSFNGWPKLALPALIFCEHFLKVGDLSQARMFYLQARTREPGSAELKRLAQALETGERQLRALP